MWESWFDFIKSATTLLTPATVKATQQEGRRQRADGRRIYPDADSSSLLATDKEQGFESPNWSSGSSSGGVQSPFEENLLPSASLLLPSEHHSD
jgi:hypothetical protein